MKLLKIENSGGSFRNSAGQYVSVDKIGKQELMQLVHWTLHEQEVEFDEYDEKVLQNKAHQVIFKSLFQKLRGLRMRKDQFIDESARLYLEDYQKYRDG